MNSSIDPVIKLKIFPRHIHALWAIIRSIDKNKMPFGLSLARREFKEITKKQFLELEEASLALGFINPESKEVTTRGFRFSRTDHWRFWLPPKSLTTIIDNSDLRYCFIEPDESPKKVLDLFAGVGGLTCGFEQAGFRAFLSIDNDDQAVEAHEKNFPRNKALLADIFELSESPHKSLQRYSKFSKSEVSGIVGGPPCQGFSLIGERVTEDERNMLTSKFMDFVCDIKPDFFVMENVPGLKSAGIRPKFSNYIRGLCKSIGEPASEIVRRIPSVPKRVAIRDAQYRKRLISAEVLIEKDNVNTDLQSVELSEEHLFDQIVNLSIKSESRFTASLADNLKGVYEQIDELKNLDHALSSSNTNIATISLTLVLSELFTMKVINEKRLQSEALKLSKAFGKKSSLGSVADKVIKRYEDMPVASEYNGQVIGPILKNLIDRVSSDYEITDPTVINAAEYGTPQARRRLFLVGIKKKFKKSFEFPKALFQPEVQISTSVAIGNLPNVDDFDSLIDGHEISTSKFADATTKYQSLMALESFSEGDRSLPRLDWNPFISDCNNRTLHADHVIKRMKKLDPGKPDKASHKSRLHPNKPSNTLRAGTKGNKGSHTAVRPIHYEHNRVISVREGARIMGYPDWMTFHRTKWHGFRLVGNGVCAQVANVIANKIKLTIY